MDNQARKQAPFWAVFFLAMSGAVAVLSALVGLAMLVEAYPLPAGTVVIVVWAALVLVAVRAIRRSTRTVPSEATSEATSEVVQVLTDAGTPDDNQ